MSSTSGEDRVRKGFNPSGSLDVETIKGLSADLIDLMDKFRVTGEQARCASLAATKYEEAAMWAVKAATWKL